MINNFLVFTYLIVIFLMGIYYRPRSGSFKNFATVKDSARQNKLLLVATIFASSVGGGTTFGIAEKAFSGDISYSYGLLFTIPLDILIAKYLVPRLGVHYGAESIGDIMAKYYGRAGRFVAGIASIIVSIGFLAAQISVSGRIFQYILQVDHFQGVVLSYSIVIAYTTIGGLRSIMFTNLIQFVAMLIGIPIVTIIGLNEIGVHNFFEQLPSAKISLTNDAVWSNTIAATLGFAVMGLHPTFIQRALINNNPRITSRAIYIKSLIYAAFLVFITVNGLIAFKLYPDQLASLALPYLVDQIIPSGLQGIVVIGLLAAVMSTADSDLNISSVALVKDLISPIFAVKEQQRLLFIARMANIGIGSFAIVIALSFSSVVDLVIFAAGFWGPIILVPLIFGLFNITTSQIMMVVSSCGGSCIFLIWEKFYATSFNLKGVFVGTVASLIIFLLSLGKGRIVKPQLR